MEIPGVVALRSYRIVVAPHGCMCTFSLRLEVVAQEDGTIALRRQLTISSLVAA